MNTPDVFGFFSLNELFVEILDECFGKSPAKNYERSPEVFFFVGTSKEYPEGTSTEYPEMSATILQHHIWQEKS